MQYSFRCSRFAFLNVLLVSFALLVSLDAKAQKTTEKNITGTPPKKPKKFGLSGSISIGSQFYSNIEGGSRNRPFTWMLTGTPVIRLFGYDSPLNFTFSEQQRSFSQPFNLVGISPRYKKFTFHLGYRSMSFSQFTYSGLPILGVGFEMNPGKLRAAAIYGRINRAVTRLDSLSGFRIGGRLSYERMGYAARLGYGTQQSYFDLIFLKAWDDSNSIAKTLTDSARLNPAENVVIGANSRIQLSSKFSFEAEVAFSAYTGDIREKVNEETGWNQNAGFILKQRLSTSINAAGRAGLAYTSPYWGLRLDYKQVSPDYRTMGIFFIQSDIEQYTVSPNFSLFKQRVQVSGSVGYQTDNIQRTRAMSTTTLISNANLSINPGNYGIDIMYSNFGISQKPGLQALSDTIRLAQTNHSVTVSQHYTHRGANRIRSVYLLGSHQLLQDLNKFTAEGSENQNTNVNLSWQDSPVKSGISWSTGLSYNNFKTNSLAYTLAGLNSSISRSWLKNKLNASASASYQLNFSDGIQAGAVINGSTGIRFNPAKAHTFSLQASWIKTNNTVIASQNFQEIFGSLQYRFTF